MFTQKVVSLNPSVITVESTEQFLKELMPLIAESKGVDPNELNPLFLGSSKDEKMHLFANENKWLINRAEERKEKISLETTRENAESRANSIVSASMKEHKDYLFLLSITSLAYRIGESISDEEVKKEFIHKVAISLHHNAKDWAAKNGGWLETYVAEAFRFATNSYAKDLAKSVAGLCVVGVGLFAAYRSIRNGEVPAVIKNAFGFN